MDLRDVQRKAFDHAKKNGWYSGEPDPEALPKYLAYMHSELSEILEGWRRGEQINCWDFGPDGKPEGIPTELADIVIWAASLAGRYQFDLDTVVAAKLTFNSTRPRHHGSVRV